MAERSTLNYGKDKIMFIDSPNNQE